MVGNSSRGSPNRPKPPGLSLCTLHDSYVSASFSSEKLIIPKLNVSFPLSTNGTLRRYAQTLRPTLRLRTHTCTQCTSAYTLQASSSFV